MFLLTKIIKLQIKLNRECVSYQYFTKLKAREMYLLEFSISNFLAWTMNFLYPSLGSHEPCHTFGIMIIQLFLLSPSF